METLSSKRCVPCEGGVPALSRAEAEAQLRSLASGWQLSTDAKRLDVTISVDDPGTFNMPWSARQTYTRSHEEPMLETICAENNSVIFDAAVSPIPQAAKPDF